MKRARLILLMFLFSTLAGAAFAANVSEGEKLARRWCAGCHIVSADQKTGGTEAPPFSSIAKETRFDAAKLALFLLLPHPRMPDMSLTRNEAADLAAYIRSQGDNER